MNNEINIIPFIEALTGTITVTQVLAVLASVVGVGMTFFLMWLGVRWITHNFTKAISTGKIPITPKEPSPKKQKKEINDWYATHDSFGRERGYSMNDIEEYLRKH